MSQRKKYCVNCFTILPWELETCSSCDYPQPEDDSPLYLRPPFRLNNQFFIGRVLGHGGFAITYLAYDRNLSVPVAIKEYFPIEFATRASDGASIQPYSGQATELFNAGKDKFIAEARLLTNFRSPNIIKIRQFFKAWNTAYFVMEYLEGQTLTEHIKNKGGKLSYAEARKILLPLLDALEEVHQKGTFHRDIKPDNIYMTQKGEPILLDFGAARQTVTGKTTNLMSFLTPGFAPSEQYSINGIQGPWTDIYALAATMYYTLTGELAPVPSDRIMGEADLVPPSQLGSDIPEADEAWLLKALEVRWSARPDSVQSWRALIDPKIHLPSMDPEAQTKAAEENFTKIAILPKLTHQILTRRAEEEIYASAAFMEIPMDRVLSLIEKAMTQTGSVRRNMTEAEEKEIQLAEELKRREEELQRKEEELRHFEELRNKEEELWWEAELVQQAETQRRQQEEEERRQEEHRQHEAEKQKLEAELKRKEEELRRKEEEFRHFEELRSKEEEMWWNAEVHKLDEEARRNREDELQRKEEALKRKEEELKRAEALQRKEAELRDKEASLQAPPPPRKSSASKTESEEIEDLAEDELNELLQLFADKPAKKAQTPLNLDQHYAQIAADFASVQPTAKALLPAHLTLLPDTLRNALGMDFVLVHPALTGSSFLLYQAWSVGPPAAGFKAMLTKPFYLQTSPVTQQQWEALLKVNPAHFQGDPQLPVEQVSWDDCQLFIHRLNLTQEAHYRLPTEVEWEFACRAGARSDYCFGDDPSLLGEYAWFQGNAEAATRPVAQKKTNELGLFDMHGNVREWVQDGFAPLPEGEFIDPKGLPQEGERVTRGGGWQSSAETCRAWYRSGEKSAQRFKDLGFRLVIEIR